jgi:hypothetical protein
MRNKPFHLSGAKLLNRKAGKIGRFFGLLIANIAIFRPKQGDEWQ